MTQEEIENKWFFKRIISKGYYKIPDKEYFVTGCHLEHQKFAIMATDYSKENKHFISFDLVEGEFEKLDERFEILGDYNNINYEILYTVKENGLIDSYCYTNGNRTENNPIFKIANENSNYNLFNGLSVGTKIYDICFISTTNEKWRKTFLLNAEDSLKTEDEIYKLMGNLRSWVKIGYHFYNFEDLFGKIER